MQLEHRLCVMHLYANAKRKFGGGSLIRDLIMAASKATYYQSWEEKMNLLKKVDVKCWEWLMGVPTKYWCKHAFSFYPKCDIVMNNLAEAFNSTILNARDKPILTMVEWIRDYLMHRMGTQTKKLRLWPHKVMPKPLKRLNKQIELSGNWYATWSEALKFQVVNTIGTRGFIVDLESKTCTCNFWQLVGMPCKHACSAIAYREQKAEDYVDVCYTRYSYELAYCHGISAINGQDMWPVVPMGDILPPDYKRGPGRPRKLRRRQPDEPPRPTEAEKLRRTGTRYRCTKCNSFGHNSRGCKSTVIDPEAQKRKRKARNTSAGEGTSAAAQDNVTAEDHVPAAQDNAAAATGPAAATEKDNVSENVDAATGPAAASVSESVQENVTRADGIRIDKLPLKRPRADVTSSSAPALSSAKGKKSMSSTAPSQNSTAPSQKSSKGKKTLGLQRTRYSTRMRKTVIRPTGPGYDPNKPVVVEDDEEVDGASTQDPME